MKKAERRVRESFFGQMMLRKEEELL